MAGGMQRQQILFGNACARRRELDFGRLCLLCVYAFFMKVVLKNKIARRTWECLFRLSATCPACLPCPVMHGSEGSAWARNLGVPLSDLRHLCVSIDGWGGESRYVHPNSTLA